MRTPRLRPSAGGCPWRGCCPCPPPWGHWLSAPAHSGSAGSSKDWPRPRPAPEPVLRPRHDRADGCRDGAELSAGLSGRWPSPRAPALCDDVVLIAPRDRHVPRQDASPFRTGPSLMILSFHSTLVTPGTAPFRCGWVPGTLSGRGRGRPGHGKWPLTWLLPCPAHSQGHGTQPFCPRPRLGQKLCRAPGPATGAGRRPLPRPAGSTTLMGHRSGVGERGPTRHSGASPVPTSTVSCSVYCGWRSLSVHPKRSVGLGAQTCGRPWTR